MSNDLPNDNLAEAIERDGYAVVRNVFTADQLAKLRTVLRDHFAKRGVRHNLGLTQPNAAVEVSSLAWLYYQPQVISLFRRAFRTDDIVFTGHCDIHNSMLSGWHKDSGEKLGGYFNNDYFAANDCKVYKMAIYLEDHFGTGKGLTVRRGSQHTRDYAFGPETVLDTKAGDAILFDVRITHVGQRPDFFERALMAINSRLMRLLNLQEDLRLFLYMRKIYSSMKSEKDRLSIFFTFGYPNHFTDEFSKSNMARQIKQTRNAATALPPPLVEGLKQAGVRISSVLEEKGW